MSKRLFIAKQPLGNASRASVGPARVWTTVVVEPEIRTDIGGPPRGAPIGPAIGPFAQQRLNEALGFSIRLGAIRPREALTDRPASTDRGEDTGPIGHCVVREEAAHTDAAATKPRERALQKGSAARGVSAVSTSAYVSRFASSTATCRYSQPTLRARRRRSPWMRCPTPATRPSRVRSMCRRSPTCGHSYRWTGRGSSSATRLSPAPPAPASPLTVAAGPRR